MGTKDIPLIPIMPPSDGRLIANDVGGSSEGFISKTDAVVDGLLSTKVIKKWRN